MPVATPLRVLSLDSHTNMRPVEVGAIGTLAAWLVSQCNVSKEVCEFNTQPLCLGHGNSVRA